MLSFASIMNTTTSLNHKQSNALERSRNNTLAFCCTKQLRTLLKFNHQYIEKNWFDLIWFETVQKGNSKRERTIQNPFRAAVFGGKYKYTNYWSYKAKIRLKETQLIEKLFNRRQAKPAVWWIYFIPNIISSSSKRISLPEILPI